MCMRPANERRRYSVMLSFIGWAHTQNYPCEFRSWINNAFMLNIAQVKAWVITPYTIFSHILLTHASIRHYAKLSIHYENYYFLRCNIVSHWLSPYPEWLMEAILISYLSAIRLPRSFISHRNGPQMKNTCACKKTAKNWYSSFFLCQSFKVLVLITH